MPEPAMRRNHGNRTHAYQMLEYFHSRSDLIDLDYMAPKEWEQWNEEDEKAFQTIFPKVELLLVNRKASKDNKVRYFFKSKLPNIIRKNKHPYKRRLIDDYSTYTMQQDFNLVLTQRKYDVIIISYVTWARLIENNPLVNGARLIVDTHDFMTGQFKGREGFQLGPVFEREMQLLSLFDETWSQSYDEQYLFSQFVPAKHRVVPIMYSGNHHNIAGRYKKAKYDLIYVASGNPNNQNSSKWFFDNVYPLLSKGLKICLVGQICEHSPDLPNVVKNHFVPDLSEVYTLAKVAICPMLEGTGVKVKVVEAMSFGLPTVCTLRGLDGLPGKVGNGCLLANNADEFAAHIDKLLSDEEFYLKTSGDGVNMFKNFFDKRTCYQYLDEIFDIKMKTQLASQ